MHTQEQPIKRQWLVALVLSFIALPIVTFLFIAAFGFLMWFGQILFWGPPT